MENEIMVLTLEIRGQCILFALNSPSDVEPDQPATWSVFSMPITTACCAFWGDSRSGSHIFPSDGKDASGWREQPLSGQYHREVERGLPGIAS